MTFKAAIVRPYSQLTFFIFYTCKNTMSLASPGVRRGSLYMWYVLVLVLVCRNIKSQVGVWKHAMPIPTGRFRYLVPGKYDVRTDLRLQRMKGPIQSANFGTESTLEQHTPAVICFPWLFQPSPTDAHVRFSFRMWYSCIICLLYTSDAADE